MRPTVSVLVMLAALVVAGVAALEAQQQSVSTASWENFKVAQENARKADDAGRFKEAYEYYLEYVRQAEGLNRPEIAAWGRNNAAFMLIKLHKHDSTADLTPAKKLLEEALASPAATDDCKKAVETNVAYVATFLGRK